MTLNSTGTSKPDFSSFAPALALLKYFEKKYKCSNLCKPDLFFWSLNLDAGIPESSNYCLKYLISSIGDNYKYLAITFVVCGGMLLVVLFF